MDQAQAPVGAAMASATALPLVDKLASYVSLSDAEIACLTELHEPQRKLGRHREVIVAGRRYDQIFILRSGVVSRYKVLPDGKRQILDLGLPGDLIGVPSCLFETAVNSVSALTDAVVAPVPFPKLFSVFARYPRLGTALFWSSACELAVDGEHLVNLGRRTAYERLAHLLLELLELLVRLRAAGLAEERSYVLPLTQELMADVLGLSVPHINRVIRNLREEGLATVDGQQVTVHDFAGLSALAGFEERYLARGPIPGLT
jgi:CRP-like cAMP-binding protein